MIIGIVCVDKNWAIGKDNHLLFDIKEDMKFFKEKTAGHVVCMGYSTLLSLPKSKPLRDRLNIVIAPEGVERDDCIIVHTLDEMLKLIKAVEVTKDTEVYICGGAMFYNSMLPYYNKVYVTKVNSDGEGTVFFPDLDKNGDFVITDISKKIRTESGLKINFVTYERIN